MKLWMDDLRPAPEGWVWAKSAAEAKRYLETGEVEEASLDHDLGEVQEEPGGASGARTLAEDGSSLVRWMAETGHWPKRKPTVHSMNPVGGAYMRSMIERYGPY